MVEDFTGLEDPTEDQSGGEQHYSPNEGEDFEGMDGGQDEVLAIEPSEMSSSLRLLTEIARRTQLTVDEKVKLMTRVLQKITPADLHVGRIPTKEDTDDWTTSTKYFGLMENADVSMGVFVMQPGTHIPLHNHPNMCVISKCLFGKMTVTSYDLKKDGSGCEAKCIDRETLTEETEPSCIQPDCRNLHEIEALDVTAFIDIFLPPYSDNNDCEYFQLLGQGQAQPGDDVILEKCYTDFVAGPYFPLADD